MTTASPISSWSTTACVVTSVSSAPRSSSRASITTRSSSLVRCAARSGFDETIRLLAQAEGLLCEAEEVRALAAHAALLARWLDDAAVDDPAPGVAAIDREAEHGLIDLLQLGDRELRRKQLKAER